MGTRLSQIVSDLSNSSNNPTSLTQDQPPPSLQQQPYVKVHHHRGKSDLIHAQVLQLKKFCGSL